MLYSRLSHSKAFQQEKVINVHCKRLGLYVIFLCLEEAQLSSEGKQELQEHLENEHSDLNGTKYVIKMGNHKLGVVKLKP